MPLFWRIVTVTKTFYDDITKIADSVAENLIVSYFHKSAYFLRYSQITHLFNYRTRENHPTPTTFHQNNILFIWQFKPLHNNSYNLAFYNPTF